MEPGAEEEQQEEEEQAPVEPKEDPFAEMVAATPRERLPAALRALLDHNGKLEPCEAYSCELYLEADHRENTCPSWYDPRPMMVDSCRPCLKDASSSFDLDYYGLPSCSSKGTDTASKQIQLKKAKKGSIKLVRELFRAAHKKGRQHLPSAQALS